MTYDEAFQITGMLAALPYFPAEEAARAAIANGVMDMCASAEQALWLMNRALTLWSKWESLRDLRAILCARYRPKDGCEVNYSGVFADGVVPSEKPRERFAHALALPPGRTVSADREWDEAVIAAARAKQLDRPPAAPRRAESAVVRLAADELSPSAAPGSYQPVTEEDVERARAEWHAKKQEQA